MNKKTYHRLIIFGLLFLAVGMACQLTSPRPASWAGTPTAEARLTHIAQTQAGTSGEPEFVFTPTLPTPIPEPTLAATLTPTPIIDSNGPWLIFAEPNGSWLKAYDIHTKETHTIELPEPIISTDLVRGYAPNGNALYIRAGSALNTEELALYQIILPSHEDPDKGFEVSRLTSLLSISLQRQIVNEEGTQAVEALTAVTRPDGLAWSPDGRFLAFSAALNNETSDLYLLDTLNDQINRANRYLTHNASPFWSPDSSWLVSQELELNQVSEEWRATNVAGLIMPAYINQDTVYTPPADSREEVFVGWRNVETFISYSVTETGGKNLRQVTSDRLQESMLFEGPFDQLAFDPESGVFTFIISHANAINQDVTGGLYRMLPDSTTLNLQQGGLWENLRWDPAGKFVAAGLRGVLLFTPDGESMFLPGQGNARFSPNGTWLISWGDGLNSESGARLYQSANERPLQTLLDGQIETVFWQPDSKGFFLQSEGVLYHFVFPGLSPIEIASDLPLGTALDWLWVE